MATILARIGVIGEAVLPGRRKVRRSLVHVEARVTSSRGDRAAMTIGNVSMHGCNVRGDTVWLRIGSFVGVALDEGPPLQAIVRWVRDGSAGLEFMRPVAPGNRAWHDLINSMSDI